MAKVHSEQSSSWVASPLNWAAVTVATGAVAYGMVQPTSCDAVSQCAAKHDAISTNFNMYSACGLMMVLIGETANLISTFQGAKEAQAMVMDLRSRSLPSFLLVCSFMVLICESGIYAINDRPWFSTNRPDIMGPVFTATFVEWLIIVPMLLTMAGHCALGRPLKELGQPIMVTNIYIILSWVALVTPNFTVRWSLIFITFLMYFWASWDMILWVAKYLRTAPLDLSSRSLRPCLSLGLIALFAVYAVVYMLVVFDMMDVKTERLTFLFLNVGSKLAFSVSFVVIRGNEYHRTITGVLKKLSTSNVAVVSILRGSFDILLPCIADGQGRCQLPGAVTPDMAQLEHTLQRSVTGMTIGELLANDEERQRFAAYVRNSQRMAIAPKAVGGDDWAGTFGSNMPPVAQVLNCNFSMGTQAGIIGGAVHLSVVPSSNSFGLGRQMVAAVRFTDESTTSRPEEAAPEFKAFDMTGSTADTDQHSNDTKSISDEKDDRMIASLLDVARLGMSALLHSTGSVSGDGEVESGYDDSASDAASFVKPVEKMNTRSTGTMSGIHKRPNGARSIFSNDDSEDSASVIEYKAPKAAKTASSVASSQVAFNRLTTLLEPEEEHFSRNTTDEQTSAKDERAIRSVGRKSSTGGNSVVGAAMTKMAQELLGEPEPDPKDKVTVTMRVAPMQFNLAVGTVALAAAATLFSARRRF